MPSRDRLPDLPRHRGLVLGLVPGLPRIQVDPDLIFLIVLPPLLYIAAFFTPVQSLRANLGTISSLAVGLVVVSACAVAAAAHALLPGLTWSAAFVLGAIVAHPTRSPPAPSSISSARRTVIAPSTSCVSATPRTATGKTRELIEHREIRRTVIDAEREALLRLRAEGEVSDEVLRDLERELDLEERRMDA